jgi:hypothetical protein
MDRRWHSGILDIPYFKGCYFDTGRCLVVTKFGKGYISYQIKDTQKFDVKRK